MWPNCGRKELSRGSPATSSSTFAPSDATDLLSPEPAISETLKLESTYAPIIPTSADQLPVETVPPPGKATETSVGTPLNEDAMTAAKAEVTAVFNLTSLSLKFCATISATLPERIVCLIKECIATSSIISAIADGSSLSITSVAPTAPSSVPAHISDSDEIDISAIYAELGLDEHLTTSQSHEQVPLNPPESEEERTERLRLKAEETACKHADIEARHSKWEVELRSQMETGLSTLKLEVMRSTAAAELVEAPDIRDAIESLVADAEKYIKGAEIYLRNPKGESRKNDEKIPL